MPNLKEIIKVTKAQMETLIGGGSVGDHTLSDDVLYAVEKEEGGGGSGAPGLSIYDSSEFSGTDESTARGTTSLQIRYITVPEGRQLQIGDLIIAHYYYLYRITAIATDRVTVTYLHPIAPIIYSIDVALV